MPVAQAVTWLLVGPVMPYLMAINVGSLLISAAAIAQATF